MQKQGALASILETGEKTLHPRINHSVMVLEMFPGKYSEPELQECIIHLEATSAQPVRGSWAVPKLQPLIFQADMQCCDFWKLFTEKGIAGGWVRPGDCLTPVPRPNSCGVSGHRHSCWPRLAVGLLPTVCSRSTNSTQVSRRWRQRVQLSSLEHHKLWLWYGCTRGHAPCFGEAGFLGGRLLSKGVMLSQPRNTSKRYLKY